MKKTLSLLTLGCVAAIGCNSGKIENSTADATGPTSQVEAAQVVETAKPTKVHFVQANSNTATLKVKFVLDGKAPERAKVNKDARDAFCAALDILSETMLIGEGGEIQNMAMILNTRKTKADIPAEMLKAPEKEIVLDNKGCVFTPHIIAARPGQTILVTNSDQAGHNANFNFFKNTPQNFLVPAAGEKGLKLEAEEPAPIPVDCNIHPWMKAHLIVTEHPYVGITDENGELTIENLPVGEVAFKIWHENSVKSISEGTVAGKKEKWKLGIIELDLAAGVNDLGTIKIAVDQFKD